MNANMGTWHPNASYPAREACLPAVISEFASDLAQFMISEQIYRLAVKWLIEMIMTCFWNLKLSFERNSSPKNETSVIFTHHSKPEDCYLFCGTQKENLAFIIFLHFWIVYSVAFKTTWRWVNDDRMFIEILLYFLLTFWTRFNFSDVILVILLCFFCLYSFIVLILDNNPGLGDLFL